MFSSIFNFNFTCFSDDGAASTADGDKKSTRGKRGSSSSAVQQKGVGDDDDDEDDEDDDDDDDDEDDEEEDDEDDEEEDEPKRSPSSASSSSSKKAASKTEGSPGPVPLGNADRAEVLSMLETNATPETIVRAMKIAAQAGDLTIGLAILDVVLGALSPAAILHDLGSAGVCRATVRLIEVHEKNQDVFAKGIKILAQLGKEPSNIALFDAKPTALCLSKCMRAFPDPESLLLVAQVVELLLQGDTLNHKSMAASFLDNDLFVQLVNAIDSQEENLSNTSLVNTVCRILVELCPVRPTGTCHTSIDLAHTFSVLQDVLDRVFLVHQSQRAAAEFSDVVAAKEHFKWACRTYGVPVDRISGTDGPRVRKKRHISKQNLLKMLEIMLHVTDSSSVGVATRILTGQQDDPFPRKESKSKNNAGEGGKAVGSLQSSSSLSPSTSQRFQGDSKTTQSYQAYCKALQAAVTFISDEDDGTDGTQEMQTELPSGENQNADSDVSAPTNPTALSPASTSVVAAYFSNPPEPRPPSPPPIGPLIGKRPKGFVHRSRRFDVETSLRYDSSKKHSLPPSAVAFKKSISADRSSGPLYNADIQYSMALAKCGPYYSSKRSSTAAAPPVTLTPYDAERCIERLAKTASMDPLNKNALFYLGKLLSEFRDNRLSDDAENFFKDVLALDPVHPEVYYNLGQIFFQR
jgi:tetratricopeptide (TPR) repeat protein